MGLLVLGGLIQSQPGVSAPSQTPSPSPSPSTEPGTVEDPTQTAKKELSLWVSQTQARLVIPADEEGKITGLTWNLERPLPVLLMDEGAEIRLYVDVSGSYTQEEWALIFDSKRVEPRQKKFSFRALIEGRASQLELVAVGPEGELQRQKAYIIFEDWDRFQTSLGKSRQGKRWAISPGLGLTWNGYEQTGVPEISQWALTGKLSLQYVIRPPNWDLGINAFYTLQPLKNDGLDTAQIRFLGSNLRLGYVLPFVPEPWRISLQAGYYYITMMVPDGQFGFSNISGPQVFPSFRRILSNGDSVMAYVKFSPVSKQFALLQMSNREIAWGGGWGSVFQRGFLRGKAMFLTLDFADLSYLENGIQADSRSVTLGVGLGF